MACGAEYLPVFALLKMPRTYIRKPKPEDAEEYIALMRESVRFHRPWVEPATDRKSYSEYLARIGQENRMGFFICLTDSDRIAGVVNLNEIVRGAFMSAYLGYWIGAPYEGQGIMREGLSLVIGHAFDELDLHRLEANIQPENRKSIELVKRLGFTREGFSRKYLKIAGDWRDHERWAILREDWD